MRKRAASSTPTSGAKPPITEKRAKMTAPDEEGVPPAEYVGKPAAGDDQHAKAMA